jgi:hypothetical protein
MHLPCIPNTPLTKLQLISVAAGPQAKYADRQAHIKIVFYLFPAT